VQPGAQAAIASQAKPREKNIAVFSISQ